MQMAFERTPSIEHVAFGSAVQSNHLSGCIDQGLVFDVQRLPNLGWGLTYPFPCSFFNVSEVDHQDSSAGKGKPTTIPRNQGQGHCLVWIKGARVPCFLPHQSSWELGPPPISSPLLLFFFCHGNTVLWKQKMKYGAEATWFQVASVQQQRDHNPLPGNHWGCFRAW